MTPANTAQSCNVFAGMLLVKGHDIVLREVTVQVFWPAACELLEYAA